MSASCDPCDRPGGADPYAYFAARGVSREALRDFLEAEVERSVRSNRVEGSPIAELYRLLGLDWTVTLAASLGGTESYVPWSADAAVGKWPGLPAGLCELLVDRFGGGRIALPSLRGLFATCRREQIARRIAAGLSHNAVAREFGLTARYVRSVAASLPTPGRLARCQASQSQAPVAEPARGRAEDATPC